MENEIEPNQIPLEIQLANARAEISRLHEELTRMVNFVDSNITDPIVQVPLGYAKAALAKTAADVGNELARLRRDKARLDWLADSKKCHYWTFRPHDNIRKVIDAAMEETQ
jgi:hypothetical protein